MPTGEMVSFSFERWLASGRPSAANIAILDGLRPHLARAGLIAARLRLERARSAVAALDAIGLAAAVLNSSGRILVANMLFEERRTTFIDRAHGRMAVADTAANVLFNKALAELRHGKIANVHSIPVRARDGSQPSIVHILPLVRDAHATFSGADILVVATALGVSAMIPSPKLLNALFDLSPSEARLAAAVAAGQSLKRAAQAMGITFKTARSYLEKIFRKTGTH
jgi:DNA-binding CsgD family transcriptional regulator